MDKRYRMSVTNVGGVRPMVADRESQQQQSPGEIPEGAVKTSFWGPVAQREYETYMEAEVNGKPIAFFLDSGCCTSSLPARMVNPDETRTNTSQFLAVNKSPFEVVSSVTSDLTFGKQTLPVKLNVSHDLHEPIIGIGFLSKYDSRWDFTERRVKVTDKTVPSQTTNEYLESWHVTTIFRPERALMVRGAFRDAVLGFALGANRA